MSTRFIVFAAVYAALYAVLTLLPGLNSLAYGQVQFRVAEGLMACACFDPAAVPGLTIGTAIANIGSPMGAVDVVGGALLTLVAALAMWRIGPHLVALVVPVLVNGPGVAAELAGVLHLPYWASAGWVALGEATVLATAGTVVFSVMRRYGDVLGARGR